MAMIYPFLMFERELMRIEEYRHYLQTIRETHPEIQQYGIQVLDLDLSQRKGIILLCRAQCYPKYGTRLRSYVVDTGLPWRFADEYVTY